MNEELFGELHEQEEYGLFGNYHRRQYEAQQEALRTRLNCVADCGLRTYQLHRNYKRVVTLKISTNTAINYTTGYSQFLL